MKRRAPASVTNPKNILRLTRAPLLLLFPNTHMPTLRLRPTPIKGAGLTTQMTATVIRYQGDPS